MIEFNSRCSAYRDRINPTGFIRMIRHFKNPQNSTPAVRLYVYAMVEK